MRKMICLVFTLFLIVNLSACGNTSESDIIDRQIEQNNKILDEIDRVQEKSDYLDSLIDDYKNGR